MHAGDIRDRGQGCALMIPEVKVTCTELHMVMRACKVWINDRGVDFAEGRRGPWRCVPTSPVPGKLKQGSMAQVRRQEHTHLRSSEVMPQGRACAHKALLHTSPGNRNCPSCWPGHNALTGETQAAGAETGSLGFKVQVLCLPIFVTQITAGT